MRFAFDGNSSYRTENGWPYSLGSDEGDDYKNLVISEGAHTLSATPFSGLDATGTAGKSASLSFSIVDNFAKGDVNRDSRTDIIDALLTAQYYVGLAPVQFDPSVADVNGSGTVDIIDALLIAQCYVGLVSCAFQVSALYLLYFLP